MNLKDIIFRIKLKRIIKKTAVCACGGSLIPTNWLLHRMEEMRSEAAGEETRKVLLELEKLIYGEGLGWIECEKRMPILHEERGVDMIYLSSDVVLAQDMRGKIRFMRVAQDNGSDPYWLDSDDCEREDIMQWMPVPTWVTSEL